MPVPWVRPVFIFPYCVFTFHILSLLSVVVKQHARGASNAGQNPDREGLSAPLKNVKGSSSMRLAKNELPFMMCVSL